MDKDLLAYTDHLKEIHAARDDMFQEMRDIYLMKWDDEARVSKANDKVKITKSSDPRDKLRGMTQLMIATDPVITVKRDEEEGDENLTSDMEKWASHLWLTNGNIRKKPLHYDVVLSVLLFDEVHIGVTKTADMLSYSRGSEFVDRVYQRQAERIASQVPYTFDVYDPMTGYPDIGPYGLAAMYREISTSNSSISRQYRDWGGKTKKGGTYGMSTLCHYWDNERYICWVKGDKEPIKEEGRDFIPFVVQLGQGSSMFGDPEDWRQPVLYSIWKSEYWQRQNLIMTALFTNLYAVALNATFIEEMPATGERVVQDFSRPGGVTVVPPGGKYYPMMTKGIIDPAASELMSLVEGKISQSTIYDQTLGAPMSGSNAGFNMVALLHQAGRLPLIVPQRAGSQAIGDALTMALEWYRKDGNEYGIEYPGSLGKLDPAMIPVGAEVEAKLDVDLPQDQLQQAQLAAMLSGGDDPIISKGRVREDILSIQQPEDEQRRIYGEKALNLQFQKYVLDQMIVIQQMEQQAMTPTPPPGQGMPGQGMPGQMPPEMQQMPPEMMGQQGLPPEMMGQQQPGMPPPMQQYPQQPGISGMEGQIPPEVMV